MDKKYYLLNEGAIECFPIRIHSGNNQLRIKSKAAIKQYRNGLISFNPSDNTIYNKYYIVGYEWNGARYSVHTTNRTSGTGVGGKLIGTSGLVTGSGKTSGVQREIEEDTIAFMDLQSFETGEIQKISFYCNTRIDAKIRCLKMFEKMDGKQLSDKFNSILKQIQERIDIDVENRNKLEREKQEKKLLLEKEKQEKKEIIKREKQDKKERKQHIIGDKKERTVSALSIIGFSISIISLLLSCIILGVFPAIISLTLCIISLLQNKYSNKVLSKIGLIISCVSIVISILIFAFGLYNSVNNSSNVNSESFSYEYII